MTRFIKGFRLACVLLLGLAATAYADTPQAMPPALVSLETMVSNLGYTVTESTDKQSFSIPWSSDNYNYKIHFDLSEDRTLAYAYVDIDTYTQAQLTKMKFVKILEASDSGDFYFSMESNSSGATLYANAIIPMKGLTPQDLRSTLEGWAGKLDASRGLWDTSLWK